MRHKEPEVVTLYKEWVKAGPPRCCHTCEHYGTDGLCIEYWMNPPEDFAASVNACDKWQQEVPF
ncbi:MAG: hypothetical protein ACK42H_07140 [Planctomycetota bacterium]|jgi:hypothetical protein